MIKMMAECDKCHLLEDSDGTKPKGWHVVKYEHNIEKLYCCTDCMVADAQNVAERLESIKPTLAEAMTSAWATLTKGISSL